MVEIETIEIDGIEYLITKRLKKENDEYFLLSNIEKPEKFLLAKTEIIDGEEYITEIIDNNEYKEVLEMFVIKE